VSGLEGEAPSGRGQAPTRITASAEAIGRGTMPTAEGSSQGLRESIRFS